MTLIVSNFNKYYFEAKTSGEEVDEDEKQLKTAEAQLQEALNAITEVHRLFATKVDDLRDEVNNLQEENNLLKEEQGKKTIDAQEPDTGVQPSDWCSTLLSTKQRIIRRSRRSKGHRLGHSLRGINSGTDFIPIPGLPLGVVQFKRNTMD